MKNTYSILERNRIVEEHLWCIDSVMRKNHALIRAARLDYEEVYQQLALRLIRAVETFDPDKGVLRIHILAQLKAQYLQQAYSGVFAAMSSARYRASSAWGVSASSRR